MIIKSKVKNICNDVLALDIRLSILNKNIEGLKLKKLNYNTITMHVNNEIIGYLEIDKYNDDVSMRILDKTIFYGVSTNSPTDYTGIAWVKFKNQYIERVFNFKSVVSSLSDTVDSIVKELKHNMDVEYRKM